VNRARGFFLTLEGIEGSGKSTQGERLARGLAGEGFAVHVTREPGGTPLAESIRHLLLGVEGETPVAAAELFLILAARAQHVERVVRPCLDRGMVVLCDRFADASLAYQGGGRGLGVERVAGVNALATGGLAPDLTLVFDLPVEEALERVHRRGATGGALTRFDREAREFYGAVRTAYLDLARAEPGRVHVLDARGEAGAVAERVDALVRPRLAARRAAGAI
jgi:dTMP kinase